jgi:hypothetical protein
VLQTLILHDSRRAQGAALDFVCLIKTPIPSSALHSACGYSFRPNTCAVITSYASTIIFIAHPASHLRRPSHRPYLFKQYYTRARNAVIIGPMHPLCPPWYRDTSFPRPDPAWALCRRRRLAHLLSAGVSRDNPSSHAHAASHAAPLQCIAKPRRALPASPPPSCLQEIMLSPSRFPIPSSSALRRLRRAWPGWGLPRRRHGAGVSRGRLRNLFHNGSHS